MESSSSYRNVGLGAWQKKLLSDGSSMWSTFQEFKARIKKMTDKVKKGKEGAGGDNEGVRSEDGVIKLPESGSCCSNVYGRGEGGPANEDIISVSPLGGGAASSGATEGGGGELGRGDNLPAPAPVRTADPVPGGADIGGWDGQGRGWGGWGGAGGGYCSGRNGPGRGGTGYGIDVGSGNCAAGGNDIRIRNVLGQLSEGMQVGSHNASGVDNVMSLDLSANPSPQAAYRDVVDTGQLPAAGGGGGGN